MTKLIGIKRSSARYKISGIGTSDQSGATLIEVLISVVIVSIGLLGIASMQLVALRNSQSALQSSMVTMQSYSLLDSMRANRDAADKGEYNETALTTPPAGSSLVASDKAFWITAVQDQLGASAKGAINCDGGACTIDVTWNDSERGKSERSVQTRATL